MKHRKVDQGIGGQEKVGDDGGDDVQFGCKDKVPESHKHIRITYVQQHVQNNSRVCRHTDEDEGKSNPKSKDVASEGFVVLSVTFGKDAQTRVDVVLT